MNSGDKANLPCPHRFKLTNTVLLSLVYEVNDPASSTVIAFGKATA